MNLLLNNNELAGLREIDEILGYHGAGADVSTASSWEMIFEILRGCRIDAFLYGTEHFDDRDRTFLKEVRRVSPSTKVLVLLPVQGLAETGGRLDSGLVDDFIHVPLVGEELVLRLKAVLERKETVPEAPSREKRRTVGSAAWFLLKGLSFSTRGDANSSSDAKSVTPERILGRVEFVVPWLGYFITFAQSREGLVALVILPAAVLVAYALWSMARRRREIRG